MDLAKTLVRSVVRSFYETKHILIIDALVIHSALRDDDLAYLISMNIKDLHKMCQKLKEDRLLVSHSRSETREGQQRPNNRTYYYIDYRQTIDAIKWRVYKIDKDVQGPVVPPSEKKEYFCDHCKAEWTQMEVLDNSGPRGFLCHRCGSVLRHGDSSQSGGHERSSRMNNQFKFITDLLPRIDSVVIPDNNFETAFNNKRPVVRDATHQIAYSMGIDPMNRPTAVKGLANTGPSTLSVSIQAGNGPTEEELAAERAYRERVAQQNALPSWMSKSTVTGEAFKTDAALGHARSDADTKNPTLHSASDSKTEAQIDDYFSRLKKLTAEEAAQKKMGQVNSDDDEDDDDDDGDDDEEEEEFEDVVQPGQKSAANAAGSMPAFKPGSSAVDPTDPPASAKMATPPDSATSEAPPASAAPPVVATTPSRSSGSFTANSAPKAPSPLRQAHSEASLKREAAWDPPSPKGGGVKKVKMDGAEQAKVKEEAGESDEDEDGIEFEDV